MEEIGRISKESVDVFTWQRHANRGGIAREVEATTTEQGRYLSGWLVGGSGVLEDKTILDAGCGGGNKTVSLAASTKARLVVGLDGSRTAIDAGEDLAKTLGVKNVRFVQGYMEDAQKILDEEGIGKVDFVFNSFNLHHVDDYTRLLAVFSDALKPGGYLLTIYVVPDRGLGGFLIKNKIAYHLGRRKEGRMRVGKLLFGWYDRRHNLRASGSTQEQKVNWDSFFADRYSAFYRFMPTSAVVRAIRETGFEVIETKPPLTAYELLYKLRDSRKAMLLASLIRIVPLSGAMLTALLRIRQFIGSGDTRAFLCIKTSRPNIHSR